MATAYVTVDHAGDLTRTSVVTVVFSAEAAMEIPVPARGVGRSGMFWHRINAALSTIGWAAMPDAGFSAALDEQGRLCFPVREVA